jgi:hypothetical protein
MIARRLAAAVLLALLSSCSHPTPPQTPPLVPRSPGAANGIFVDSVKTYDEATLEQLLNKAVQSLSQLNAFSSTVTGQLGTIQGSVSTQTSATISAGSGTVPTQSPAAGPSVPSGVQTSASNYLNEELQLSLQIMNMQLLLNGALNDQSEQGNRARRRTKLTLGFPINITTPAGFKYQNAVAEVDVSVCAPMDSLDAPILSLLLPQEKTYNVASLVSKSATIGANATIAGAVNAGGSFLRGRQTLFLVQDQDTLAMQLPPDRVCPNGKHALTFAWQFRPVLGQNVVRAGLKQSFAQISFSPPQTGYLTCSVEVMIKSGWRHYDQKTGRVGESIGLFKPKDLPAFGFTLPPVPDRTEVTDNGDGSVTVRAFGAFRNPTRVRIGGDIQNTSNTQFEQNYAQIRFVDKAGDLVTKGASLLNNDGLEWQIIPKAPFINSGCPWDPPKPQPTPRPAPPRETRAPRPPTLTMSVFDGRPGDYIVSDLTGFSSRVPADATISFACEVWSCDPQWTQTAPPAPVSNNTRLRVAFRVDPHAPPGALSVVVSSASLGREIGSATFIVDRVSVRPFDDTQSLVTVWGLGPRSGELNAPEVVVIGNKTFGLGDLPYYERTGDSVTVLAANDLIRTSRSVIWENLVLGPKLSVPIDFWPPDSENRASDFNITNVYPLSASSDSTGSSSSSATSKSDVSVVFQPAVGPAITVRGAGVLTVAGDTATPTITSISPAGLQRGESRQRVLITGAFTNFGPATTVRFSDPAISATNFQPVDSTHLYADLSVGTGAKLGSAVATVQTGAESPTSLFSVGDADNDKLITLVTRIAGGTPSRPHVRITGTGTHFRLERPVVTFDRQDVVADSNPVVASDTDLTLFVRVPLDVLVVTGSQKAAGTALFNVSPGTVEYDSETLVTFALTDAEAKAKNIVIEDRNGRVLVRAMPDTSAASTTSATTTLDPQKNPIAINAPTLTVQGKGLKSVVSVRYLDQSLPFTASSDTELVIQKLPALTPQGIDLVFVMKDKTLLPYFVAVAGGK